MAFVFVILLPAVLAMFTVLMERLELRALRVNPAASPLTDASGDAAEG